jgi:hypothetical protein
VDDAYEVWANKGKGSCAYFAARGFPCQAGGLVMNVDVGKFRKMIHDYVKDRQLELLAQDAFCKQYHPTNIAYTMGNIWKSQIDWYGLGVGPKYFWSSKITHVLCLLFQVIVAVS